MVRKSERNKVQQQGTPEKVVERGRKSTRQPRRKKKSSSESENEGDTHVDKKDTKEVGDLSESKPQIEGDVPEVKQDGARARRSTRRQQAASEPEKDQDNEKNDKTDKSDKIEKNSEWKEDPTFWGTEETAPNSTTETPAQGTTWKIQSSNGSGGEIQKLKICRQRVADSNDSSSPVGKDAASSPRRKRSRFTKNVEENSESGDAASSNEGTKDNKTEEAIEPAAEVVPSQDESEKVAVIEESVAKPKVEEPIEESGQVVGEKKVKVVEPQSITSSHEENDSKESEGVQQPSDETVVENIEVPESKAAEQSADKESLKPTVAVLSNPSKKGPSKPVKKEPSKPAEIESSKPAEKESSKPAEKEPSKPAEKEPSKPAEKEPSKPTEKEPSKPAEKEPSKPAEKEPSKPAEKEPPKPAEKEPSKPVEKEASKSPEKEPPKPAEKEPSKPAEKEHSKPADKEPPKPAEKEPSKPAEKEPSKPAEKEPSKPTEIEPSKPVEKEPSKPAENETSKPTEKELLKPTEEEPTEQPQKENSSSIDAEKSEKETEPSEEKTKKASETEKNDSSRTTVPKEAHVENKKEKKIVNLTKVKMSVNSEVAVDEIAKILNERAARFSKDPSKESENKETKLETAECNEAKSPREEGELTPVPEQMRRSKHTTIIINKPREITSQPTRLKRNIDELPPTERKRRLLSKSKSRDKEEDPINISSQSLMLLVPEVKTITPELFASFPLDDELNKFDIDPPEEPKTKKKIDLKPIDVEVRVQNDTRHVSKKKPIVIETRETSESKAVGPKLPTQENHRVIRKISIVNDDAKKPRRSPSPGGKSPTEVLFITNLVRPFTVPQLRELLARTGTIAQNGFYIDKIKSKCYVKYTDIEMAVETRHALNGVRWPVNNPKTLKVEFAAAEDMAIVQQMADDESSAKKVEAAEPIGWLSEQAALKPQRRVTTAVREWDMGKVGAETLEEKRPADDWRLKQEPSEMKRRAASPPEAKYEPPARKIKKRDNDAPARLLDDLFRKTKATPCIYWLPLTAAQIAVKEEMRRQHMAEHERRIAAELRKSDHPRRDKDREKSRDRRKK